jgi:hypothetical protein
MIIALLTLMPIANAQNTWKPKSPKNNLKFRMGIVELSRRGYSYMIIAQTNFTLVKEYYNISLGSNRENALETINQLIEVSESSVGNTKQIDDVIVCSFGNKLKITEEKGKINYGEAYITTSELKKMKKFIEQGK